MEYTQNYHLPQWVETDRILMDDFNGMASAIDAALKTNADSLSAETAARESAVAAKGNCRIVYGSYTGTGKTGPSNPCVLTFDAQPMAVFAMAQNHSSNNWAAFLPMIRGALWSLTQYQCIVSWSGNSVSWYCHENSSATQLSSGVVYYVALLAADE